jgi:hypothetical protein
LFVAGRAAKVHCRLFVGPFGARLDGVLTSLGMAPHFANHGNGGEIVLAVVGVIVVLVAGMNLAQAHDAEARGGRQGGVSKRLSSATGHDGVSQSGTKIVKTTPCTVGLGPGIIRKHKI